jgi:peptide/nickel transport system substrate-binding protein
MLGLALLATALPGYSHHAQAADLAMGIAVEPNSLDPHFHHFGGNINLSHQIFEPLVGSTADGKLEPKLAASWRAIDDQTWEFTLRPGVKFHDGTPLTAADVAFTLKRAPAVPQSPGGYGPFLRNVESVEAPDPARVIVRTKGPVPLLPNYLALIGIVSEQTGKDATTQDYNSGKAVIGTGPYRFVSWAKGSSITLKRNDAYWGEVPAWDNVRIRYIPNVTARAAALRAGDVDMIDGVSADDVDSIKGTGKFNVRNAVSNNVIALQMNVTERKPPFIAGPNGEELDRSPLADVRVRKALAMALNKDTLKDRVMNHAVAVVDQIMSEGQYGFDSKLKPIKSDPEAARKLLAEAGYPNGFRMTMHCQSDRFAHGSSLCQAAAQMFTRIGVRTEPTPMPHNVYMGRANKHEFSFYTVFMVVDTGEPSQPMVNWFVTQSADKTYGGVNRGQYSNPAFDELVKTAARTVDSEKREPMLHKAAGIMANDVPWIPLFRPFNIQAMKNGLDFHPRNDGYTFAADVHQAAEAKK